MTKDVFPCFGPKNEALENTGITSSAFSAKAATHTNNNVAYGDTLPILPPF